MTTVIQEFSPGKPGTLYGARKRVKLARIMIRLTVREVAEKEGIANAKELAERANLHYESCRLIWQGRSRRIDLDTLEKLCDALHVRPGQLFDYQYEPGRLEKAKVKTKRKE